MNTFSPTIAGFLAACLLLVNASASAQPARHEALAAHAPAHDPTSLLITARKGMHIRPFDTRPGAARDVAGETPAAATLRGAGVVAVFPTFNPPPTDALLATKLGLDRMYVAILADGVHPPAAAAALAGFFERVELNPVMRAGDTTPDDPAFADRQWPLRNTGANSGGVAGADIAATRAWDIETGSASVLIAIIDSGINGSHPDLAGKVVGGRNFLIPETPTNDWADDNSHGSHCAGIAAANSNNAVGIAGVCWGCRLLAVKVLDRDGSGTTAMTSPGIVWAADAGARVISMSLGGGGSEQLEAALEYAYLRGCFLVAASGNDGSSAPQYPAAYARCVSVGNTTASDTLNQSSNYGTTLDVTAPGTSVYSTVLGSGYGTKTGTSMAAPHVAGLAGLVRSVGVTNPADIRLFIVDGCDDLGSIGWDQYYGHGRIDAHRTLLLASAGTWVDFTYTGVESGTYARPYNTLPEALNAAPVGGTVKIKSGSSPAGILINRDLSIVAPLGDVLIGR
ncbi:MAG: peptidase S8 [Phycisphaerae bacterium]|nr:peptidase S8 [Phycisphaerae bacterium]